MIPVTVFTGFLGAGKTTIIINLIKSMPKDYRCAIIKNEFGDVETDSLLLKEVAVSPISSPENINNNSSSNLFVKEYLNGCVCCVLVGQLKTALLEIKAPIAWQINQLNSENIYLDAILTVVDCVNFPGYEDTSYTAKLQAQYTDLILLNKHEQTSERELDLLVDKLNELNLDTPKIKVDKDKQLEFDLVFGIETKHKILLNNEARHFGLSDNNDKKPHTDEVQVINISHLNSQKVPSRTQIEEFLVNDLDKEYVYRVKGFVNINAVIYILNFAFGRLKWTELKHDEGIDKSKYSGVQLTIVGVDLRIYYKKIQQFFRLEDKEIKMKQS